MTISHSPSAMNARFDTRLLKLQARTLGFDACGIAPVGDHPELAFFQEWLARGYAGDMTYLQRTADRRADVRRVMPAAQTVIVTATVYNTARPYSTESAEHDRAHIARYAWGDDYHEVIAHRLDALVGWMHQAWPETFEACAYVDTGPVQERVYAQYAGVGWIGKNTCVINPALGSWIFLGEIICTLPLDIDAPAFDQCGTCTLCLEACPTQAIVSPGVVDATRCTSYLTIEKRGDLLGALRAAVGTHVYGCDICQDVCPWNQTAAISSDPAWQPRPVWDARRVKDLADMTDADLQKALRGSPMKRTRLSGMRRNLAVALENVDTKEHTAKTSDTVEEIGG
jgi:epoxyqueuosine reductase